MRRTHPILIIHPSFNIGDVIEWRIATRSEKDRAHKKKGTSIFTVALSLVHRFVFESLSLDRAAPRYTIHRCDYPIRLILSRYILVRNGDKSYPLLPSLTLVGLILLWTSPRPVVLRATESLRRQEKERDQELSLSAFRFDQRTLKVL